MMHDWLAYLIAVVVILAGTGLLALIAKGVQKQQREDDNGRGEAQKCPACWTLTRGDILLVEEPGTIRPERVHSSDAITSAITRMLESATAKMGVVDVNTGFRIIGKIHLTMDDAIKPMRILPDGTFARTTVAVDFDGTICKNAWPEIGEPDKKLIAWLIDFRARGGRVILWTCRHDAMLDSAVAFAREQGLEFDMVNANLPEHSELYGGDCRKVFADYYIDDKAVNHIAGKEWGNGL